MNDFNDQDENFETSVDEWGDPVKKSKVPKNTKPHVDEWGDPVKYIRVNDRDEKLEYLSEKQKLRLEKELVAAGLIFPRSHYLPRGRFRSIFAVLLAFVFGLFLTLGTLVGAGVIIGASPLDKTFQYFGMNASDFVGEDYLDMTILEAASDLVKTLGKGTDLTVNDLRKYSPYLDKALDGIWGELEKYGITVDKDVLYSTAAKDLTGYFTGDFAASLEIGRLAGVTEKDSALLAILYGERGVDYTIDEEGKIVVTEEGKDRVFTLKTILDMAKGEGESIESLVFGIPLGSLLGYDVFSEELYNGNPVLYTLCYGTRGIDWEVEDGMVKMLNDAKPVTVEQLKSESKDLIDGLALGSLLGLDTSISEKNIADNSLMYTLCYGSRDKDWTYDEESGEFRHSLADKTPTTVFELTSQSNTLLDTLPLGEMIGLKTEEDYTGNELMFTLSYGTRGTDWDFVDGTVVMNEGSEPLTVGELISKSGTVIEGMAVADLLGLGAEDDNLMRYIAFGNEIEKDDDGNYTFDPEDPDLANLIVTDEKGNRSYPGNANYYIKDGAIVMLGDPNTGDPADPTTWTPYPKKTVGDLKNSDELVADLKIGEVTDVGDSGLLYTLRNWTIDDLNNTEKIKQELKVKDLLGESTEETSGIVRALSDMSLGDLEKQETIDGLLLGDVLNVKPGADGGKPAETSGIVWALRNTTIGDLQKQETIDSLKLGEVLDLGANSSGIMTAMKDWNISDLSNQKRIERLKLGQVLSIDENDPDTSSIMKAMKDWRLSDLSDQNTINSLTLGDVLSIDEDTDAKILVALKDTPLGKLSDGVNSLTLLDILGDAENSLSNNKILTHLKGSTVETLADDMSALTLGEVFGDQIYSYMEIKEDKITYASMYAAYRENHAKADYNPDANGKAAENSYIPKPMTKESGGAVTQSDVTVKYMATDMATETSTVLSEVYRDANDKVYSNDMVKTDPKIVSDNRKEGATWKTPYYCEESISVTPVYTYYVVDYEGEDTPIPADEITQEGSTFYYNGHKIFDDDDFSLYYTYKEKTESGETEVRVDLERKVESYIDAEEHTYRPSDVTKKVEGSVTSYSVTQRTELTKYYVDSSNKEYQEEKIQQTFWYNETQVDRYMRGIWFLLLEMTQEGKGAETPVLEMDGLVTEVNNIIAQTRLWELYFHGLLPSNPYLEFALPIPFDKEGAPDGKETIGNLNDVTISELVPLINNLTSKDFLSKYLEKLMQSEIPGIGG